MNRWAQSVTLAALLHILMPRDGRTADILDFKVMYYQESDDRIQVVSPSFLYQSELSEVLSVKIDGVYDAISGASPTGTPGLSSYGISGISSLDMLNAVSGATPTASSSSSSTSTSSSSSTTSAADDSDSASTVSGGSGDVPLGEMNDTRYAGNVELIGKRGSHAPAGKFSISTEDDYDSIGVSAKDAVEFDKRNTTLTYGGAYNHDTIKLLSGDEKTKNGADLLIGVTRILTPLTSGKAILTVGRQTGFLNDQYKSVELNGDVFAELRPSDKTDMTLLFSLLRALDIPRAGVETSYRFYTDDFGIDSHMLELVWNQEISSAFVVSPVLRYYQQSEADFYAVRFTGAPEYYSSDYRLSELVSTTYGLKVLWKVNDRLAVDVAYEKYDQEGQDGETDDSAYPSADVVTAGGRLWF